MMEEIQAQVIMGKLNGINPSCFYCKHNHTNAGSPGSYFEPPTEDENECLLPENQLAVDPANYEYDPNKLPEVCGHFEPIMVTKCYHCGVAMNMPMYLSEYWTYKYYGNEPVHCCSEECRAVIIEEANQEELVDREQREEYQRYLREELEYDDN